MPSSLHDLIASYRPELPLAEASTIPAPWYTDARVRQLEARTVFSRAWMPVCRAAQVAGPGQFVTLEMAGEPLVVVRGADNQIRGFFNVCRHHAAAVVAGAEGVASQFRCPYHGWTYGLDGALKGTPDFAGVCGFDRADNGLVAVDTGVWEGWVFVRLDTGGPALDDWLGADLVSGIARLGLERYTWVERRTYSLACNWKVFVDNYLDGGYHVPHLHKGLDSVLDYTHYLVQTGERFCRQSSPLVRDGADPGVVDVRHGDRAEYYWIYPAFMLNVYGDAMDTNLVIPRGVERTDVVFDFFFTDASEGAGPRHRASIEVSERVQEEDVGICESVQRGLGSRAYVAGRLSLRREAGEWLFHRLLHSDLSSGTGSGVI
jgi:choline monooxygenase